jgi:hypothetical protein
VAKDGATLSTTLSRCQGGYTRGMRSDRALREAMLIVDHTAYQVGEFGILRQIVNNST